MAANLTDSFPLANTSPFPLPPTPAYHNFYITLTHQCNLQCIYCGEEPLHSGDCRDFNCNPLTIRRFLEPYQPYIITLYGGEPCLRPSLIEELLDILSPASIVLHTNGTCLRDLNPQLARRLDTIILSIDGGPDITNTYRGTRTYEKIVDNVKWLLDTGWSNRLFARMTVSEQTLRLDDEVLHLLNAEWCRFTGLSWQLNALFKSPGYTWRNFHSWAHDFYLPAIDRLAEVWVKQFTNGAILPIIPFNELLVSLITAVPARLRCGAGWRDFAITTQGNLLPCPIAGMEAMQICRITDPVSEIHNRYVIKDPCTQCPELHLCGGRCLFANHFNEWGRYGFDLICECIKFLINSIRQKQNNATVALAKMPRLWPVLSQPVHHGCEVIP